MASKKLDLAKNVQRIAGKQVQAPKDDRQPSINYPISTRAPAPELPAQAGALSERLQEIARQYIGARQRSGEALLDAARYLNEARAEAQHGEWQGFLEATGTSDDAAERLLNIHRQAMQNPQFAESIRTNWIGQSVAALLARPSTPPEVVAEVLESPTPPSVAEVQKKLRQSQPQSAKNLAEPKNPQIADFGPSRQNDSFSAMQPTALDMLREVVQVLAHIERSADELHTSTEVEDMLTSIERSVGVLRGVIERRKHHG